MPENNRERSPCNNECLIENGYCVGCNRNSYEIFNWITFTEEQKLNILKQLKHRNKRLDVDMSNVNCYDANT